MSELHQHNDSTAIKDAPAQKPDSFDRDNLYSGVSDLSPKSNGDQSKEPTHLEFNSPYGDSKSGNGSVDGRPPTSSDVNNGSTPTDGKNGNPVYSGPSSSDVNPGTPSRGNNPGDGPPPLSSSGESGAGDARKGASNPNHVGADGPAPSTDNNHPRGDKPGETSPGDARVSKNEDSQNGKPSREAGAPDFNVSDTPPPDNRAKPGANLTRPAEPLSKLPDSGPMYPGYGEGAADKVDRNQDRFNHILRNPHS